MATIIPGYDFGVNEIPEASTLRQQATGLAITGLSLDDLGVGVSGMKYGDTSNTTDALEFGDQVGTLWVTPMGDIFVKEGSGDVALNRILGGWETRRALVNVDTSFPDHIEPFQVVQHEPGITGPYEDQYRTESGSSRVSGAPGFKNSDGGSMINSTGTGWHLGVTQHDTTASVHLRICGRGLTIYTDRTKADSSTWNTLSNYQNTFRLMHYGSTVCMVKKSIETDVAAWRWFGWCPGPGPSSSLQSNGSNTLYSCQHVVHLFGNFMAGNEG